MIIPVTFKDPKKLLLMIITEVVEIVKGLRFRSKNQRMNEKEYKKLDNLISHRKYNDINL
jgi:hypothetical protein